MITFHVPTFHVPTFHVPTFHVPRSRTIPAVNEWKTNKRMWPRPSCNGGHTLPLRFYIRTFHIPRSHIPRSTFPRSHVPRSHVPTFPRSTFHVPRSHVPTFHVPVPSPLSTNGKRINECGRAPLATGATLCPSASTFAHSTFHIPHSTFYIPRSHVSRSTFPYHPRCQRMENE